MLEIGLKTRHNLTAIGPSAWSNAESSLLNGSCSKVLQMRTGEEKALEVLLGVGEEMEGLSGYLAADED